MKLKFKNGQRVWFQCGALKGEGRIVGYSGEIPGGGYIWLIEFDKHCNNVEDYSYDVFPMPEGHITPLED